MFEKTLYDKRTLIFFTDGTYKFSTYKQNEEDSYWYICALENKLFFKHKSDQCWYSWSRCDDHGNLEQELIRSVNDFIFEDMVLEAAE